MGSACAIAFRRAGYDVLLWARNADKLDRIDGPLKTLESWCDEHLSPPRGPVNGGKTPPGRPGTLNKTTDLGQLDQTCDVVLDCIIEVMDQKVALLSQFDQARQRGSLFLSATSGLSISEMAHRSRLDDLLVGAHFWNPPHIIPVVEMIQGKATPEKKVATACDLMTSIDKIPIVCKDVPGFVGNRLLHAMWREALHLVGSGVCSAEDVDRITKWTFALRLPVLGPIENMDYVGLDATERIQRYMGPELANNKTPDPCLTEKLERGDLGVKSGRGFYDWSERNIEQLLEHRDRQVARQLEFLKEIGELPGPLNRSAGLR